MVSLSFVPYDTRTALTAEETGGEAKEERRLQYAMQ
jgi:hypothetical protein